MFVLNIKDEWDSVTDSVTLDTLEDALNAAKQHVLGGQPINQLELLQEIELSFTVDVKVKTE